MLIFDVVASLPWYRDNDAGVVASLPWYRDNDAEVVASLPWYRDKDAEIPSVSFPFYSNTLMHFTVFESLSRRNPSAYAIGPQASIPSSMTRCLWCKVMDFELTR